MRGRGKGKAKDRASKIIINSNSDGWLAGWQAGLAYFDDKSLQFRFRNTYISMSILRIWRIEVLNYLFFFFFFSFDYLCLSHSWQTISKAKT